MLRIENLTVAYGNILALRNVAIDVAMGEIVALVGANGAGKTTLLKTISRLLPCKSGRIQFQNQDITRCAAADVVGLGISHVPEGRRVFREMSIEENLEMGAYSCHQRIDVAASLDNVFSMFPVLRERRTRMADTLSGGEQQMLALGRALMARPRLLLLDEPSMGLAPQMALAIFQTIKSIVAKGTTILLVEQNASMALAIAHRAYVLETGRIVLSGPSAEIAQNPQVAEAYLGKRVQAAE